MHKSPESLQESPAALTFLGGGFYRAKVGQDYPPHTHNCWELVCYTSGQIDAPVGDARHRTQPGMFLLTPPGIAHAERALTAYSNVFIAIDGAGLTQWPLVGMDDASRSITETCSLLVAEWQGAAAEHAEMVDLLLRRLGILLRRSTRADSSGQTDGFVSAAERIMEERYATGITIEQLSREIGCAPSTLRERFLRHRSRSPHDHLVAIRLRHATSLIHNSTAPLEAIANMTGFYSSSHLSRTVRKATGKSPGAFRGGAA